MKQEAKMIPCPYCGGAKEINQVTITPNEPSYDDLKKEIVKLKTLLFRHRRAINSIHSIASDMQEPEREHGPQS
jgi:hypothetical protein